MSATLIVNPWASRVTPEVVAAVERELEAAGPLETVLTQRAGHATEIAAEASGRSERIYVLSGDGGFNEVVNGIGDDVAVGFIPGGGTSVLPRALGLPRDPVAGARALARSEEERLVTLGRVEGHVEGKIELKDHVLTIGPNGKIKAQVFAKAVIILGEVVGNVSATEKVDIRDNGSVDGDITSPKVAIAEGAHFRGAIDMNRGAGAGAAPPKTDAKPAAMAAAPAKV